MKTQFLALAFLLILNACQEKPSVPGMIVVKQGGEVELFGELVAVNDLKTILLDSLKKMATVPDSIIINFEGDTSPELKGKLEAAVADAIDTAKSFKKLPFVETHRFRKEKGTDCDKPGDERTNCATIDFMFPVVEAGPQALKDSVAKYVHSYLNGILTGGSSEENLNISSLDDGAEVFFDTHETYKGSVMYGAFEADSGTDVVLNNGKHLSFAISSNTYQGGAHGSHTSAFATFEVPTGKRLTWDDIVADKATMKALAEKRFREERAEIFQDGFEFDEIFQFKLPDNFALIESGIYLHYNPYEVGPYVIGTSTFVIDFIEIGGNLK